MFNKFIGRLVRFYSKIIFIVFLFFCHVLFGQEFSVKNYTIEDGLPQSQVFSGFKDGKSFIWFGSNKAAAKYNYYAGYESISVSTGMELNWKLPCSQNHPTFDFIGLSFKNLEIVRDKNRMIGVIEGLSPPVKNNRARFTNLSTVESTFGVIATNNNGIWNSTPTQYSFIILTPFWNQWWVAFLAAAALVVIVFGFSAFRTGTLLKQKAELERQVKLRTKEVSEEKEKVALANKKLESTNAELQRFITELERTNNELEKLSIVARETDNSIFIADSNGELFWQNDCATRTTGYSIEEIKSIRGKTLPEISFKDDLGEIIKECRKSKKSFVYEVVNKSKSGEEYWSSCTLTPILNEKEDIDKFVIVETNINYIKKIEEQLRITRDKLEQRAIERTAELSSTNLKLRKEIERREKLEEELIKAKEIAEASDKLKSEFLAQMSHEIRTPISTVLNFSTLIREELQEKLSGDLDYGFEAISRAGNRIFRTVDMILNMAEIKTGAYEYRPTEIDVYDDVLSELNAVYKDIAKRKSVEFKLNKKIGNAKIKGDLNSLTQIFTQLIDNAIKYTEKGEIEISVEKDEEEHIIVNVLDSGIGISDEYLDRLFEPFSQEEQGYTRKYDGNGLGLALVHKYCKINNIDICIDSSKGKGTKVSLIFNS